MIEDFKSRRSWPRQKFMPYTTEQGVRRLAWTTVWRSVVSGQRRQCTRKKPGQACTIDQAKCARQALGTHDRGAGVTGEFCHDREFFVAID